MRREEYPRNAKMNLNAVVCDVLNKKATRDESENWMKFQGVPFSFRKNCVILKWIHKCSTHRVLLLCRMQRSCQKGEIFRYV